MAIGSWAYWLQNVEPATVANSSLSTAVVDIYDGNGNLFTPAQVAQMGGGVDPRLLLGYVSVGEAETYRSYWQSSWTGNTVPSWIGGENPEWAGNYQVRFWDPAWKAILFDYLDKMVDAGFDGAWFDVVDVYQYPIAQGRADAAQDMINLVASLSEHTKARHPGFEIYINGAEELLTHADYLKAIDGVGKENIFYGLSGANSANSSADVSWTLSHLKLAQGAGKAVLDIEYVTSHDLFGTVVDKALAAGLSPYIGPLDLDYYDSSVPGTLLGLNPGSEDEASIKISALYETILGRLADREGSDYWVGATQHGLPFAAVADGLLNSAEFQSLHGSPSGISANAFIEILYENGLQRTADAAGLAYWSARLEAGEAKITIIDFFASEIGAETTSVQLLHAMIPSETF